MKKGFLKAVNMFTGKRTFVPVSSPHYAMCVNCSHDDFLDRFSPCSYCKGCLDFRSPYLKPLSYSLNFSELLDRIQKYCLYDY